jgi:Lrp/AsnC family leucine-responsive transcriptional regulator
MPGAVGRCNLRTGGGVQVADGKDLLERATFMNESSYYLAVDRMIDEKDLLILTILQENARTANAEIARRVQLAPSAVFERIRKMEERGVIRGYSVSIDPHAVERALLAFIFVRSRDGMRSSRVAEALAQIPEVLEVHDVAGEDCFLLKVRVKDAEALGQLLRDRLGAIRGMSSTRSTIVLETVKEASALPLPQTDAGEVAESA